MTEEGCGEGTARGEPVPGLLEILAGTAAAPPVVLEALPSLTCAYSAGGYLIAAQVICDATGLAFDEARTQLVLEPAGMTASTFRQPLPATPHRWYVPGLAGTDIAFIPPDSLRISQNGRHLEARRAQAP